MLVVVFAVRPSLRAAGAAEDNAFKAASNSFNETIWDRAESEFGAFTRNFTNSARLPEALLFQAEARFKMTNYAGVVELLTSHLDKAGRLADEDPFWTAEAQLRTGDFPAADATLARLARDFPDSPRLLEATIDEAAARTQLQQWTRVVELLEQTNGVFQVAIQKAMVNRQIVNGYFLLAKAHLAQGQTAATAGVLARLAKLPLDPPDDWQRLFLLCSVELAQAKPEEALSHTTNLLTAAISAKQPELKAESIAMQASVLERLGRLFEAIGAYTQNLAPGTPGDRHREALLKIVELSLRLNTIAEAAQTLERYLAQYTNAPAEDLAWITLGELRLRQCASATQTNLAATAVTNTPPLTNCLDQALSALHTFTTRFPQSPLRGRAELDLGWCFWLGEKLADSQAAFQAAVQHLPLSAEQATAYVKLADTLFSAVEFPRGRDQLFRGAGQVLDRSRVRNQPPRINPVPARARGPGGGRSTRGQQRHDQDPDPLPGRILRRASCPPDRPGRRRAESGHRARAVFRFCAKDAGLALVAGTGISHRADL